MACVPLVDSRWHYEGPQPHVLGVLQLVVPHGPDKGRKKRLGLEMRSLLSVVSGCNRKLILKWTGLREKS